MVKPTKEEAFGESYEIGTFVFNSLKKKTTDKMVLGLINDYEEPIRNIIDETVWATIEKFDLKTIPDLYEQIDKKANDLAERDLEDWLIRNGSGNLRHISTSEKNEQFYSRKKYHKDQMLKLYE